MKKSDFIKLHMNLTIQNAKSIIINPLPSETDPTQDIPVRMIQVTATGAPINVKQLNEVFSNIPADQLTAIERRHYDKFDVLGELQSAVGTFKGKDIQTNFKPSKKQKKHEEE